MVQARRAYPSHVRGQRRAVPKLLQVLVWQAKSGNFASNFPPDFRPDYPPYSPPERCSHNDLREAGRQRCYASLDRYASIRTAPLRAWTRWGHRYARVIIGFFERYEARGNTLNVIMTPRPPSPPSSSRRLLNSRYRVQALPACKSCGSICVG